MIEAQAREKAAAEGLSVDAYVAQLIVEDEWGEYVDESIDEDPEFSEIQAAIREGLEQIDGGEVRPAEEVFAELRAKRCLSH